MSSCASRALSFPSCTYRANFKAPRKITSSSDAAGIILIAVCTLKKAPAAATSTIKPSKLIN